MGKALLLHQDGRALLLPSGERKLQIVLEKYLLLFGAECVKLA